MFVGCKDNAFSAKFQIKCAFSCFNLFKAFRSVKGSYQSDGFGLAVRFKQTHSPMRRTASYH